MKDSSKDVVTLVQSGGASIVSSKPLFSQDSKYLICPCGKSLKVFSVSTGECFQQLNGHLQEVTGVSYHPKIKLQVLSSSLDGTIKVWDYEDGILLQSYKFLNPLNAIFSNQHYPNVAFILKNVSGNNELHRFQLAEIGVDTNSEEIKTTEIASKIPCSSFVSLSQNFLVAAQHISIKVFVNPSQTKKNNQIKHMLNKSCSGITCIACHSSKNICLTGHINGMIRIWYNITDDDNIVCHVKHWHSLEVLALSYTAGGSMFLSGGHEKVFVQWASSGPQFLPRLSSEIHHISASGDGTLFATAHRDNCILIISNHFMVKQSIEGFTAAKSSFVCGLQYDEATGACVTNGKAGHLLFYMCHSDTQLYNLDIVSRNFISAESISKPLSKAVITKLSFTTTNHDQKEYYMVTVEFNKENKRDQKMKFWRFDQSAQNWTLETVVATPHHNYNVTSARFHPNETLCITTADDGLVKVWIRLEEGWTCDATVSYKEYKAVDASFSQDGSLLALVFQHVVLICEPLQVDRLTLFASFPTNVKFVMFGRDSCCHLLVIVTFDQVQCWDVISCSILWTCDVKSQLVVQDKFSENIALFTKTKEVFIFKPSSSEPLFSHNLNINVAAACFIPKPDEDLPWSDKSTLYIVSEDATVCKFSYESRQLSNRVQRSGFTGTLKTPISSLLAVKIEKLSRDNVLPTTLRHSTVDATVKNILDTPVHVLPPMSTLSEHFISSLLFDQVDKQDIQNQQDTLKNEDMSEEMEVNNNESDVDLCDQLTANNFTRFDDFAFLNQAFKSMFKAK